MFNKSDFRGEGGDNAPLYTIFPGQSKPQDAFIHIDERNIYARYNPEIGNAVPMRPHVRIELSPNWKGDKLYKFLTSPAVKKLILSIQESIVDEEDYSEYVEKLEDLVADEERDPKNIWDVVWKPEDYFEELSEDDLDNLSPKEALREAQASNNTILDGTEGITKYILKKWGVRISPRK